MEVDVGRLQEMHTMLAPGTVADYLHKVAVALSRHGHSPGASLDIRLDGLQQNGTLRWIDGVIHIDSVDFHRVTEDAAEAIALASVFVAKGWVVRRRAQREEYADWLLWDHANHSAALEVSGVNKVDLLQRRLREKTKQVRRHRNQLAIKAACVVELSVPRCRLRTV
jgi:hypothetical protein